MNNLVLWVPGAEDSLSTMWLASSNRNRLVALAAQADAILANSPTLLGRCVFDTVYEMVIENLGIEYEVIEDDRHVRVLNVWDSAHSKPYPKGN